MSDTMQTPAPQSAPTMSADQKDIDDNKIFAALSYLGILFLIPLLAARKSKFAMFHLKQGLIWFVILAVVYFVVARFWVIGSLLELAVFIYSWYAFAQAIQGKMWEMPVIGEYAKKINL